MIEVFDDNKIIARIFKNENLKDGLNFFSKENEIMQVAIWNHSVNTNLAAHKHNLVERQTLGTAEVVFVIEGSIHMDVYGENNCLLNEFKLTSGDVAICLAGGHAYRILEINTQVLEIKNGPYFGVEADKTLIADLCENRGDGSTP